MSGNINDTDVSQIRSEVYLLIEDLRNLNNDEDDEYILKKKYKYLVKSSNGLFKYIINEHKSCKFDKELFDRNLEMMLTKIQQIQNNKETQYDASVSVGTSLANQYIPQLKK
jgi:hypothetical protein